MPRPKNPPADRRQQILEAALRLFGAKGYRATTNADIARAAGITPAALYYYFPSKRALFQSAVAEWRGQVLLAIQPLQDRSPAALPPQDLIPLLLKTSLGFLSEERVQVLLRIVLAEGPRDPQIVQVWEEMLLDIVGPVIPYLQHHMVRANIRPMDPRIALLLLQGPLLLAIIARDLLKISIYEGLNDEELIRSVLATTFSSLLTHGG